MDVSQDGVWVVRADKRVPSVCRLLFGSPEERLMMTAAAAMQEWEMNIENIWPMLVIGSKDNKSQILSGLVTDILLSA